MKTKFTPGPWKTSWLVSDRPTFHIVQGPEVHQTLARLGEVDGRESALKKARGE